LNKTQRDLLYTSVTLTTHPSGTFIKSTVSTKQFTVWTVNTLRGVTHTCENVPNKS